MPTRYVRDETINIALQVAQLPNLEIHDSPNGVVQQDAFCIQWLQDIIDYWHHHVPFSSTVKKQALSCTANNETLLLPVDFIIDVRNGLLTRTIPANASSYRRCVRLPLQKFINKQLSNQTTQNIDFPHFYCIVGDDSVVNTQLQTAKLTPIPTIATACFLWYYALPARLEANQRASLPNDYVAIEYLRIRALEWQGLYEPGTALKYCEKLITWAKSTGLLNQPEDDEIPLDTQVHHNTGGYNTYNWMGPR